MNDEISRRQFLYYGAAATAGLSVPLAACADETEESQAPAAKSGEANSLRVLLRTPEGHLLDPTRVKSIIARDLAGDPLPQRITHGDGECRVELAGEPLQLACRLEVPGFGEVYCYAANEDRGYTQPGLINFVVEAARTRLARVRKALAHDGQAAKGDPEFERHLAAAQTPIPAERGPAQCEAAYRSLARGLHAGERLVLLAAQQRISRLRAPRQDFYFGCSTSGWNRFPEFTARFTEAFNFGTASWYTWKNQPSADPIDYARMDQSVQWCLDHHITPKEFGYVYLTRGAMPAWMQTMPYEKLLPIYRQVVEETTRRFAGRVHYAEIINEIHDKANLPHLSHAQVLELTRAAFLAARRGSADVKRQINNCCLWAEYARTRNQDGSRRWSPWRYVNDCVKSNVQFENIGLQLYYPTQDLFEIERMLNRFKSFGRRIHISEIACNSAPGPDLNSMRPKEMTPGWHGPWTETMQADWAEAIYTICYSKPEFEVVGWWDLADYDGHFWPHGGLLNKDFSPKESYRRLLEIKRRWGVASASA